MNRYRARFPKARSFLAVVHAEDAEQAVRNVGVAHDNGADGAFLINHHIGVLELRTCYERARAKFPSFWLGVNPLGLDIYASVAMLPEKDTGLWRDNAGVDDSGISLPAAKFARERAGSDRWDGIYFGGVAFKYQSEVTDAGRVAKLAMPVVDVVTTSGDETGMPPSLEKIRKIREATVDFPLANASGMTPENVEPYLPYIDCFLVATGISDSYSELNAKRVKQFADAIAA